MNHRNKMVFLGGTCNNSTWRSKLIKWLKPNVTYFNPVITGEWTNEHQKQEYEARESSKYVLYVITPKMTGFYSIAEVVDDSNKRPQKTLVCFLMEDENEVTREIITYKDKFQVQSINAVKKLVESNGARVFNTLFEVSQFLNSNPYLFSVDGNEIST